MEEKKILILLTIKFPFKNGENFLSQELKYAHEHYDRIIVISCFANKKDIKSFETNDIEVYRINHTIIRDLFGYIRRVNKLFSSEFKIEIEKRSKVSEKMLCIYYYLKYCQLYDSVLKIIENIDINSNCIVTLYTFWLCDMTHVSCKIEELFKTNNIKTTVISRAHGVDVYLWRRPIHYFPFRDYYLSKLDKVYVCSQNGEKYIKEKFPQHVSKISHSYLGTNDYGLNCDDSNGLFRIVTCSSLIKLKRVDLTAKALHELPDNYRKKIQWIIIGDGKCRKKIEKYCKHNLPDVDVRFLGNINNDSVIEFYKNNHVDLFINTSTTEGLPVSMMEAQSFGIPIIAGDIGGVSEIVNNSNGMLLSDHIDGTELSASIKLFMSKESSKIIELRSNARNNWEMKFNADINYEKFYEEISLIK